MARPKRGKPGARLTVVVDASLAAELDKLAVQATRESGKPVLASEMHRRLLRPAMIAGKSCKGCRLGTCDGEHARRGAHVDASPAAAELPSIELVAPPDPPYAAPEAAPLILAPIEHAADKPKRGRPPGSKNSIKRAYPEGFVLTDEMRAYAVKHGIDPARVSDMFEHFSTFHRAKGSKFVDWTLAFYTWVRNDKQFGGKNQARNERPSTMQREELPAGWS